MAGFGDLVGALLQNGMNSSANDRLGNALGQGGLGQSGGILEQVMGGLTGGGSNAASGSSMGGGQAGNSGGGLLGSLLGAAGNMLGSASRNPVQAGGLGALAGALFGGGSGAAKGAVGGGAMAMLAGLAFQALMKNRGGAQTQQFAPNQLPLGLRAPATQEEESELESEAELVFLAMINAAKADGQIDGAEMQKIAGKLQEGGVDAEIQAFVMTEMQKPLDLQNLIARVPNEQVAAQVYAASLFAIEVDTDAERRYLRQLAEGLGLDSEVTGSLHSALGVR
jgi:uncharacterized membrane protein YebE (DUF533 family)